MTTSTCPDCGRPLKTTARGGLCPACLLGLGGTPQAGALADDGQASEPLDNGDRVGSGWIGRYKLLEIIGEGGFGTVWMAEQQEPVRRKVALKVIKLGMDTRQVVARFEAERQALALMDHPNIARVFDGGATEGGTPFFAMELVRGEPITEFCDARLMSTRERLELFIPVCQAVQHAHQKGIIHRDLKPTNILVTVQDGKGVPKIIDFGVAKAMEEPLTDKTLFTRFHQFLGTPIYMSPEQAGLGGLDVDTRTDIYSLGVLLYELLTGQKPLDARRLRQASREAMLKAIRELEPSKPSARLSTLAREDLKTAASRRHESPQSLARLFRGDLDCIVLKALENDRDRRYATANGLAADLQRYLDNEPISARPRSRVYQFQKMVRRHKLLFGAGAAVIISLVGGLITTSWQSARATRHLAQARLNAYVSEMNVAQQAIAENNLERARELLQRQIPTPGKKDLRGFEWRYLWQQCRSDANHVFEDEGANSVDFSNNGRWLAYGGWKQVIIRETVSHRVVSTLKTPCESLSFSSDNLLLATATGEKVSVWDCQTWREVRQLPGGSGVALFSPDGKWLLTGQPDNKDLVLWDRGNWSRMGHCPATPDIPHHIRNGLAFSPDGRQLAAMWVDFLNEKAGFHFWKVPSLELCGSFFPPGMPLACAAFTPDGKRFLSGTWDGRLLVWDIAGPDPKLIREEREHSTHISRLAMSTRAGVLVSAGEDQVLNLWDLGSYRHLGRLRGHTNQIWALGISADGRTIASGTGKDDFTLLWPTDKKEESDLPGVGSLIAGFTEDSSTIVLGPRQRDFRWHLPGRATATIAVTTNVVLPQDLRTKPFDVFGSKPLGVLGHTGGWLELWDLAAAAQCAMWRADSTNINIVTFSPDGSRVAAGGAAGRIRVWDVATQRELAAFRPTPHMVTALAYSPDGRTLAAATDWSPVFLWDMSQGRQSPSLSAQKEGITWVGFAPDGGRIAVANLGGGVNLFDFPSGKLVGELKGHVMGVLRAEFFPDGKTLATGGLDGKVKLWNVATCQEILTLSVPLGTTFRSLEIAPDSRTLAVGFMGMPGHHVRLFRAPSLHEIAVLESSP